MTTKTRKPRQLRSKNTVDSIIEAGFISVMRHGLEETTVLKVCDIAGVGSGTFYEYFKNKQDLFLTMHQRFMDDFAELITRMIPEILELEVADAIKAIFVSMYALLAEDNDKYSFWLRDCTKFNSEQSQVAVVKAMNLLAIEYAIKHPEVLKIKNLKVMVRVLVSSGIMLTMSCLSSKKPGFAVEELMDCLIGMALSYSQDTRYQL